MEEINLKQKGNDIPEDDLDIAAELDKAQKQADKDEEDLSDMEVLRNLAKQEIERSVLLPNGSDVYVSIYEDGILQNFSLNSKRAIQWLSRLDESLHTESFYKTVLLNLDCEARNKKCNRQTVYTRLAQTKDTIWYDLGNDDWEAIKITPGKVDNVKLDIESPMFRRSNSVYEQLLPEYQPTMKALDQFTEFLKIQDKTIFKVHLIMSFFENVSTPMMILGGEAGSFKTTITSFVKRLIDPSGPGKDDNIFALPESHDDLVIFLDKRFVPAFDNVGIIKDDTSDVFCRAVTGGANQKRQLYSDDDEVLFSFKRKIVMNGIDINPEQTDFLSRMITYPRNQEVKRRSDKELEKEYLDLVPYVLGEIFHIISKILDKKPIISPRYRLTDFEELGDLVAREMGVTDFQEIYSKKRAQVDNMGMENHPIVLTMDALLKQNNDKPIKGQTVEVYNKLVEVHKESTSDHKLDDKFPKAPRTLYGEIEKTRALLRSLKVNVVRTIEDHNKTYLTITRISKSALD